MPLSFTAVSLVSAPLTAPTSLADPAEPAQYVRTVYDGTIWEVTADDAPHALTFSEWRSLGAPSFTTAKTKYVTVLSMPTVYGVTTFPGGDAVTEAITAAEYRAAKAPRVTKAAWVKAKGLKVVKWQTSSELIAVDPNRNTHKLTYAQWKAARLPAYENRRNRGFIRMSWDRSGAIAYMCDVGGGFGGRITYAEWRALGAPTPQVVTRTRGDLVWKIPESELIDFGGPVTVSYPAEKATGWLRMLEYAEWVAMGAPKPVSTTEVYVDFGFYSGASPSPWQ